jgi:hypothetical protein
LYIRFFKNIFSSSTILSECFSLWLKKKTQKISIVVCSLLLYNLQLLLLAYLTSQSIQQSDIKVWPMVEISQMHAIYECFTTMLNNKIQLTLGNSKSKELDILLREKRNSSNVDLPPLRWHSYVYIHVPDWICKEVGLESR